MDFKTKRKAKKVARRMFVLSYALMIVFGIFAIGGMVLAVLMEADAEPLMSVNSGIFIAVALMISALITGMVGQYHLNKRVAYKQGIEIFRQNTYFTRSINLILQGGKEAYDKAVDTYELLHEDTPLRRFVFAFIVTSSYFSKDNVLAEKGKKRLNEILETYDPKKVDLNKKISLI